MQAATSVNPVRYFSEVMRRVYLKGSGLGEMLPEFAWLCGFAAALNVWAVLSYKKNG